MKVIASALMAVGLLIQGSVDVLAKEGYVDPLGVILFTNQTDLTLRAVIAKMTSPNRIKPHVVDHQTRYAGVMGFCMQGGVEDDCPIRFFDDATGEPFATVRVNSKEMRVLGAPELHGQYAMKYRVTGWGDTPLQRITIEYVK